MIMILHNVRLAFPAFFEPESVNGGAPRYSASFILDKKDPQIKKIEKAILEVAIAKWGDKGQQEYDSLKNKDRLCLHDGNIKKEFSGFEGNMYMSSGRTGRPAVIDRDTSPLVQKDGKPYGGCYVNAKLEIWAQSNGFGKRINATLNTVQFVKDGDSFGGEKPIDSSDFVELEIDQDDSADMAVGSDLV